MRGLENAILGFALKTILDQNRLVGWVGLLLSDQDQPGVGCQLPFLSLENVGPFH
jgi:hypothetical protein